MKDYGTFTTVKFSVKVDQMLKCFSRFNFRISNEIEFLFFQETLKHFEDCATNQIFDSN